MVQMSWLGLYIGDFKNDGYNWIFIKYEYIFHFGFECMLWKLLVLKMMPSNSAIRSQSSSFRQRKVFITCSQLKHCAFLGCRNAFSHEEVKNILQLQFPVFEMCAHTHTYMDIHTVHTQTHTCENKDRNQAVVFWIWARAL